MVGVTTLHSGSTKKGPSSSPRKLENRGPEGGTEVSKEAVPDEEARVSS